eukprot:CFRG8606T1
MGKNAFDVVAKQQDYLALLLPRDVFVKNMFVVSFVTMVLEFARGLFISTTWGMVEHVAFGETETHHEAKRLLGVTISAFSVGRLCASTGLGYLSDRVGERTVYIVTSLCALVGNIMYIMTYVYPSGFALVSARLVAGMSTGVLAVCRAHTAKISTVEDRTMYMALNSAAQFVGLGLSPFLTLFLTKAGSDGLFFNALTAPAFVLAGFNCIVILLVVFVFTDLSSISKPLYRDEIHSLNPQISTDSQRLSYQQSPLDEVNTSASESVVAKDRADKKWDNLVSLGIALYIFFNFSSRCILSLVETYGAPMYLEIHNLPSKDTIAASMFFGCLGFAGMISFVITIWAKRYVTEDWMLMFSFVAIGLGSCILAISGTAKCSLFVFALVLIWSIGFPVKSTAIMSSFSKILGGRPQGVMMGWIGTFGSLGRICMPLIAGFSNSTIAFAIGGVMCAGCIVLLYLYMRTIANYNSHYRSLDNM